jgi:myo-inositol-1(or 4)-monophosphatase
MSEFSEFKSTAEAIARDAGALLREFYHRGVRTEYKGDVDIVTEADRASEGGASVAWNLW